jgi:hypothetical protein
MNKLQDPNLLRESKRRLKIGIPVVSALAIFFVLFFVAYVAYSYFSMQSWRVNIGTNVDILEYGTSGGLKQRNVSVTGSCPGDVFVPTNTGAEWDAFIANKPSCVNLTIKPACGPTWYAAQISGQNTKKCSGSALGSAFSSPDDYQAVSTGCGSVSGATCCLVVTSVTDPCQPYSSCPITIYYATPYSGSVVDGFHNYAIASVANCTNN